MSNSTSSAIALVVRQKNLVLALLLILGAVIATTQAQEQRCTRATSRGIIDVGGYFTAGDRFQHAIVSNDGSLSEIFFDPTRGIFQSQLGRFPDTLALAAQYAPADLQRQNIVVARQNGEVHHLWFSPSLGNDSRLLNKYTGVVDVAAFYSHDTGIQRAIVATANGNIVELEWRSTATTQPGNVFSEKLLTNIPGVTRVSGFFAKDDNFNIVHVVTRSGDVHEIFYKDPARIGRSVIATFTDIVDIASFYTDDDQFRHAIVATRSGAINEVFYHPIKGKGIATLITIPGLKNIAGYATTEIDRRRHVIASTNSGEVVEVFYDIVTGTRRATLRTFAPVTPIGEDPSPDLPNGKPQPFRASTAGLTLAVVGDENVRYSVSLNAGVWKSVNNGSWRQLPNSPPLAYSIAIDPNNANHLVVGERDGDSVDISLNRSGIWESLDGGNTWSYELNPRTLSGCFSQAVPSVAFDSRSNIYAGTACGVAKKPSGGSTFQTLPGTTGRGLITSVTTVDVAGQPWVWGRTVNDFFVSRDAGATWEQTAIPSTVSGKSIRRGSRGDHFSLAAFDTSAFTIVTGPTTTGIISYDANSKQWTLEDIKDGDGTGLGGRRFVKSFFLNRSPFRWVLLAGTGQSLFMKVLDSTIGWKRIAEAPWPLGPGDKYELNPPSAIHVDLWDTHLDVNGGINSLWVATDGGIYRTSFAQTVFSAPGVSPTYEHQNEGLRTHHVHSLSLITEGNTRRSKIVYATADNDEWIRNSSLIVAPSAAWRTWGQQGDSNWTAADNGSSPIALIMRNTDIVHLTGFGDTVPAAAAKYAQNPRGFRISPGAFFRGQEFFNFIQTAKFEGPAPLLDIVMLAKLPLAAPDPNGKTVLIRNRTFAANPNSDESRLSTPDWVVEDSALPDGAQRVWSSGGHANPVFYIYTENAAATERRLFRRSGIGQPWREITPPFALLPGHAGFSDVLRGPAFVNPYNPNHLLVSTVQAVMFSGDGGMNYTADSVLTALITGSGKYPMTGFYRGGNGNNVVHFSQAAQIATLSHIVFSRDDPGKMVVAAPFTGVFYLDQSCGYWQDLTAYLPAPRAAVPSVGIDHELVYVATEGRSIYQIRRYEFAPRATFFSRSGLAPRQVAQLLRANGAAIAGATLTLTCLRSDGSVLFRGLVATDASGIISFPGAAPPGNYTIHLDYVGALPLLAPSNTSFTFTL